MKNTQKAKNQDDGMPHDIPMVYVNENRNLIWACYGTCLTVMPIAFTQLIYGMYVHQDRLPSVLFDSQQELALPLGLTVMCTIFTMALWRIARRIIHRMYFDEANMTFTLVYYNVFMQKSLKSFTPDEVSMLSKPSVLANALINKDLFVVTSTDFISPRYFTLMMGKAMKRQL